MKSGLWILILVLVVAVAIGILLKPRLSRMIEEEADLADQEDSLAAEISEIQDIEDSETKISRLEAFVAEHPESQLKANAYYSIGREILYTLEDPDRFASFARRTLDTETDAESKAVIYYLMYRRVKDSEIEEAADIGRQLLADDLPTGWIYNHIGYDLAEKGEELDLALSLCDKGVEFAEGSRDSASHLDSRGWVYYKKGMYPEAIADLEAAVALQKEPDEEVLRHLAYAFLKGGHSDRAFDTFRSMLVMGEYDFARSKLDSMMQVKGYTAEQVEMFESSIWKERMDRAGLAQAFALPTLDGVRYEFAPPGDEITVINFFSPT
jgi:tetratricopeptide (TPR) repeat protein